MNRLLPFLAPSPVVTVLRLQGAISTGRGGLSDSALAPLITRAFSRGRPAAVALEINSPGGSPVQSALIAARIRRLSEEKKVPVHAFVEDVAASGGYWLASAADAIWVDPGSIVGSIGVISTGFGLQDLIARHGIERRIHTAGAAKSQRDPFQPQRDEDVARLKVLLDELHGHFIAHVRARRGARLTDDPALFTGEFWLGQRAVGLGLADGIGHLVPKMQEIFGPRVRFRKLAPRRGLFARLGMAAAGQALDAIEERAMFARYGL
ncbi:MAG: S49 family peptidase [Rubellimicrobium sp.]|nr:S49 family peptidase [Rubellimicrobium sp.]